MDKATSQDLLLPERYPQHDLFICDVADAVLKDAVAQMEHPFYTLSKKPDRAIRRYEHNGNWLEIIPSVKGLATIYDKDILIYAISQIIEKLNRGEKVAQRVRINTHELLMFTNRGTAGKDYKALCDSLDRLAGTRIRTNVKTGDEEVSEGFGLIDAHTIKRKFGLDGRLLYCEVKLSDWVFNAIRSKEVLTLHRDYFRLRKPIERRVYEIARKHCGRQDTWRIGFDLLLKKSGSQASSFEFRRMIRGIVDGNHLPDYEIAIEGDNVVFRNRGTMFGATAAEDDAPAPTIRIGIDAYEEAKAVAPGYDIYFLEREFLAFWHDSGRPVLKSVDKAFIGFCKRRYERNPSP